MAFKKVTVPKVKLGGELEEQAGRGVQKGKKGERDADMYHLPS